MLSSMVSAKCQKRKASCSDLTREWTIVVITLKWSITPPRVKDNTAVLFWFRWTIPRPTIERPNLENISWWQNKRFSWICDGDPRRYAAWHLQDIPSYEMLEILPIYSWHMLICGFCWSTINVLFDVSGITHQYLFIRTLSLSARWSIQSTAHLGRSCRWYLLSSTDSDRQSKLDKQRIIIDWLRSFCLSVSRIGYSTWKSFPCRVVIHPMLMKKWLYQLCNGWSLWRSYLSLWWSSVNEDSSMEIIRKRMSLATCLTWKISSSKFVQSCDEVLMSSIFQPTTRSDVHWQIWPSIPSPLILTTFPSKEAVFVTSIQIHIHRWSMNMWATILPVKYSPMFDVFCYMMNDRSNIRSSCAWRSHFRQWWRCPWTMKQHNWRNDINSRAMRRIICRWFDIFLCMNLFCCMCMMITWNNSSLQRERFSPTDCNCWLVEVNWSEWRMISCEMKRDWTTPEWNHSLSGILH